MLKAPATIEPALSVPMCRWRSRVLQSGTNGCATLSDLVERRLMLLYHRRLYEGTLDDLGRLLVEEVCDRPGRRGRRDQPLCAAFGIALRQEDSRWRSLIEEPGGRRQMLRGTAREMRGGVPWHPGAGHFRRGGGRASGAGREIARRIPVDQSRLGAGRDDGAF